ncbi:hypothetical protein B0J14DRAFT_657959 [Halenospora varia]|nr:hypothetical protein B0J14DRAFT_657959 [Halenospora varia]
MSSYKGKNKEKSSDGSQIPTEWTEWEWDREYRCYKRYRLDANNEYEYDYDYGNQANSQVPRTVPALHEAGMDDLSKDMANISFANYKVHPQKEFQWGRLFKVIWSEPEGSTAEKAEKTKPGPGSESFRDGRHGRVFKKTRRFLIVDAKQGHCICMPVNTYGGQGVNKYGVHGGDHAVIHTTDDPEYLPGEFEKGIMIKPIKVDAGPRHPLDKASRLNYAKLYTVEYNVKVWFIGYISRNSEVVLAASYNEHHREMVPGGTGGTNRSLSTPAPLASYPQGSPPGPSGYSHGPPPGGSSYQVSSSGASGTGVSGNQLPVSYSTIYQSTPNYGQSSSMYPQSDAPVRPTMNYPPPGSATGHSQYPSYDQSSSSQRTGGANYASIDPSYGYNTSSNPSSSSAYAQPGYETTNYSTPNEGHSRSEYAPGTEEYASRDSRQRKKKYH